MKVWKYCVFLVVLLAVGGCGPGNGSAVLDQTVEKDPSLDDSYYDQEKYDEMIKGPKNP